MEGRSVHVYRDYILTFVIAIANDTHVISWLCFSKTQWFLKLCLHIEILSIHLLYGNLLIIQNILMTYFPVALNQEKEQRELVAFSLFFQSTYSFPAEELTVYEIVYNSSCTLSYFMLGSFYLPLILPTLRRVPRTS